MSDKKIESLAYRLKDYESLRALFAELNFEFADEPVNKEYWNQDQIDMVQEAKIIAKKDDYRIYYIQTNTDSLTQWKGIATKIIKENNGLCLICSHNPSGFKWVFSSLSRDFSKSFTETRHVPIDIRPDIGVPQTFVEFLEKIKINKDSTASSIASQISEAFDSFAVTIHDELTVNVFEALKSLSEGIILNESNDLTLDENTLEEIREPTFILLYRIIFILYAEDRGIFPTEQKTYYEKFSFKWLKQEWLLKSENQKKLSEYQVHERLWDFFRLIELGSEDLGYDSNEFFMRSYYGRIFDRNINQKLNKWKIKNQYLLDAISLLTRTRDKNGNYFFLDYSALETRHLGSIYEHLLEYHLTVKGKKIADLPNPQERKSSGSYYTPQYIVDYIVKNTIEPLIDKIVKDTNDKFGQIEKILSLNILDPAMGSGHFLVGVVNYIAKRICEIEDEEITEQHLNERKRDVARRCVYGVDINTLAVDLAMVSLWLETVSSEKPLSFLSAHLKYGNSLLGSQIDILFDKQSTLMESQKGREQFKRTIKDFLMFENLEDDSASAVKTKIEKYQSIQSKGTIYYNIKSLLDCKIAESFGVKIPIIADFKTKIGENSLDFFTDESWQKIQQLALQHKFFHWDLEFPDIFYDSEGNKRNNSGFDAVIGNPPYLQKNAFDNDEKKSILDLFPDNSANLNTSALFITKAERLVKNNGYFGMIVPKSLTYSKFWLKDRQNLSKYLLKMIDVSKAFEKVLLEQVIFVSQKSSNQDHYEINSLEKEEPIRVEKALINDLAILPTSVDKKEFEIFNKIIKNSFPLGNITDTFCGLPYQSKLQEKGQHPVIGGKEIGRYVTKGIKGYFSDKFFNSIKSKIHSFNQPKIITQDIIAHVKYPEERIILMSTLDEKGIITVNTVNCTILNKQNYDLKSLVTILNSEIISWYSYRFIFNKAIRTMHFYEFFISKVRIPKKILDFQKTLIIFCDVLLFLNKQKTINEKTVKDIKFIIEVIIFELYFNLKSPFNEMVLTKINELNKKESILSNSMISKIIQFCFNDEANITMQNIYTEEWFSLVTNKMYLEYTK